MESERIKELANKYRSTQRKVTLILTIIILLVGIIVFALGIFFVISTNVSRIIIGSIMIVAGLLDISLSFKLNKAAKKRIANISDLEARNRYVKITGKK